MKKITLSMIALIFSLCMFAQSTINITTTGGNYTGEKWVSITTGIDGSGTQVWGQGDGTQCNGSGLINEDIMIAPGSYYVNCYDQYDDSWDGTLISVTAYGSVLGDNGGVTPTDGEDTDLNSSCEGTPEELEVSFQIIVPNPPTCTAPAGTVVLGTVDCGAGTFEVNVDVTDLGDGSPVLFDGVDSFPVAATGMFTVGPYAAGPVTFTLQHGSDTQCDVDLGTLQDTCPPVEDNCMGAITIPVTTDMCTGITTGNNTNSTDSDTDVPAPPAATCTNYAGGDIWFNLTVPASGNVTISGDVSSDCCSFLWYEIYEGTDCSSLTSVICSVSTGNDPSAFETILTGRTGGETLWVRAWDSNYDDGPGDFNFCAYEPTCVAPTVSIPADPIDNTNCPATVDVSISIDDLADSASLTISAEDDMGNPAGTGGTVSATGIFTITNVPVPQTSWTITIAHEDNTTCDVQLGPFILDCPPVNDDCINAVALTPGGVFGDNPVDGKTAYATESGYTNGCGGTPSSEVWYSVVVPAAGDITIEVGPDTATSNTGFDSVIEAYTSSDNTCSGTLTSIGCDDDGAATGSFSILALTGLTAGDTVFVRVWEFNSDETEPFSISAYSATLGVDSIDSEAAFTYYPNPVKNTLTLNAQNTIETITMYNMLGQEVLRATPNAVDSDLDMSSLQTGTYFVKVTIANITKTIRVIKQ